MFFKKKIFLILPCRNKTMKEEFKNMMAFMMMWRNSAEDAML